MKLLEQIKEDWIAHGRDWTKPGFRAVAVHRFGVWRMQIQPKLLRAPFSILYRHFYRKCRNHYGIELPYTVKLGRRVIIEHQGGIVIHGNAEIGDECYIRQGVTLGNRYRDQFQAAPKLGNRVNVGAGAKILGGITIGDDANIGANAVVLKDIPAGATAVGARARILGSGGFVNIGIVAIGRNEGPRLAACLASAKRDCPSIVYVDSGSTDNSIALAKNLGIEVIELDLSKPFSAARARNEGFARLIQIHPEIQFVQFVDGDCELAEGWLHRALDELTKLPRAAVVCGRRREKFPNASIYNRLCDLEWNTPIGQAQSCGGDAMVRITAFTEVGGFNPTVIAGEEPEMCFRLRSKAWTIHRIDCEMTLHDAAMTKFSQWWLRNVRAGHAYAQGYDLQGKAPGCFRLRQIRSIQFWTLVPPITTIAMVAVTALFFGHWWIGLFPLITYFILFAKLAWRQKGGGDTVLYAVSVILGKFPQYAGLRRFRSDKNRGRENAIIEYKEPADRLTVESR